MISQLWSAEVLLRARSSRVSRSLWHVGSVWLVCFSQKCNSWSIYSVVTGKKNHPSLLRNSQGPWTSGGKMTWAQVESPELIWRSEQELTDPRWEDNQETRRMHFQFGRLLWNIHVAVIPWSTAADEGQVSSAPGCVLECGLGIPRPCVRERFRIRSHGIPGTMCLVFIGVDHPQSFSTLYALGPGSGISWLIFLLSFRKSLCLGKWPPGNSFLELI